MDIQQHEPKLVNLIVDEYGPNDSVVVRVISEKGLIPICKGDYKLIYGVPRIMWQFGKALYESYFYELLEKIGEEKLKEILDAYKEAGAEPIHAFEIEGHFDPDGVYWKEGAKLTLEYPTGGTGTLELPDWKFRLYEGDKLYSFGTLVLAICGPSET